MKKENILGMLDHNEKIDVHRLITEMNKNKILIAGMPEEDSAALTIAKLNNNSITEHPPIVNFEEASYSSILDLIEADQKLVMDDDYMVNSLINSFDYANLPHRYYDDELFTKIMLRDEARLKSFNPQKEINCQADKPKKLSKKEKKKRRKK